MVEGRIFHYACAYWGNENGLGNAAALIMHCLGLRDH